MDEANRTSGVLPGPVLLKWITIEIKLHLSTKRRNGGTTEDVENVIDGFAFRGKQSFNKVVEEFKKFFKKGIEHDIDGIKIKASDAREKGNGLEIDIEMTYKDGKMKKNVVMVNKSKQSDSKYVLKLAENISKPWMKRKLNTLLKKSISIKGNRPTLLKCPHCDVTSNY
jgi:hypothetical protein